MRVLYTIVVHVIVMLFSLLLPSCLEEIGGGTIVSPADKPGGADTAMSYFSMQITSGEAGSLTRAEVAGTPGEQMIENIYVLLFSTNNTGANLRYCFRLQASSNGSSLITGNDVLDAFEDYGGPTSSSFRTKAKRIKTAEYRLLVVANPKGEMLTKLNDFARDYPGGITDEDYGSEDIYMMLATYTSKIYKEEQDSFFDPADASFAAPHSFTMTNANGIITLPKARLKATADDAENAPIYVSVDRVVSKVMVKKAASFTLSKGEFLGDNPVVWAPVVTNKVTFLMRELTHLSDPLNTANHYRSSSVESPADGIGTGLPSRKNIYAKDPNFSFEYLSTPYNFSDTDPAASAMYAWNTPAATGNNTADHIAYILENTNTLARQAHADWKNYTTQVLIYAYIINPGGLTATNYYSFKTTADPSVAKVFTHEQAIDWVRSGSFPADMAGLKEAIAADTALGDEKQFDFSAGTTATGGFRSSQGITYHAGGLNKYRIPLKHFVIEGVDNPRVNQYGYYGVVRNNLYTVTIGSITGPGDGLLNNYISGHITINPWWVRDPQEADLVYEEF